MSGPNGPEWAPPGLHMPPRNMPRLRAPQPDSTPTHPEWCDRELCRRAGHHKRKVSLMADRHDTRIVVEQTTTEVDLSIELLNAKCGIHNEGRVSWPLAEARRVHAALGHLLDQVDGVS